MLDDKKFRRASIRLASLRAEIPENVLDSLVAEYHKIVDDLESSSGEDLGDFRIADSEVRRKAIMGPLYVGPYSPPLKPIFTDVSYCDTNLFTRQVNGLSTYLKSIESSSQNPVHPVNSTDYWSMSTSQLEELASKYQIGGFGDRQGNVDRDIIIGALLQRDKALNPEKGIPQTQHTINVTGNVHGSNFQLGTVNSSATVNNSIADQKAVLEQLKKLAVQLDLDQEERDEFNSDIATMQVQLDSGKPKKAIMEACKISVSGVLEKVIASGIAVPLVHEISKLLHYL